MTSVNAYRDWTPQARERALRLLQETEQSNWRPFYCPYRDCNGRPHEAGDGWDFPHGRTSQRPPLGDDWLTWAFLGGRGSGKTRGGAEWSHRLAKKFPGCRLALISPTGPEVRDTLIEGESGILNTAAPGELPEWEPSKKKLTWPNGSTGWGYSGEEPDRLRGKQHHFGWLDEPAHMPLIEDVWSNFLFGLRLGINPHVLLTTSPLPIKWLKDIIDDQHTVVTHSTTYDNLDNLPPHFRKIILERYEGTRLGKQEIEGLLLDELEGALWNTLMIDDARSVDKPEMVRLCLGVDPAGTAGRKSDETGIVLAGVDEDDEYHVIDDHSGKYSPEGWARKVIDVSTERKVDAVVVEITYGRDMVMSVLRSALRPGEIMPKIVPVDSRRGKQLRAEPIVALYERGKVHHGSSKVLETLEDQQVTWIPGKGSSPDRVDAVVHVLTHLAKRVEPGSVASPATLLRGKSARNPHPMGRSLYDRSA